MNDKKLKHLEFIQTNISRMSTNSFLIKGWAITLVSALFALAQKDSSKDFVLLTYFAIPLFWYLNGYFLMQERRFRALYDDVRLKSEDNIDFSMDLSLYNKKKCTILNSCFAPTVWSIYSFMILIVIMIMYVFN